MQIQPVSNRNGKLKGYRPTLIKREPVTSEHKRLKRSRSRSRDQEHNRQKKHKRDDTKNTRTQEAEKI